VRPQTPAGSARLVHPVSSPASPNARSRARRAFPQSGVPRDRARRTGRASSARAFASIPTTSCLDGGPSRDGGTVARCRSRGHVRRRGGAPGRTCADDDAGHVRASDRGSRRCRADVRGGCDPGCSGGRSVRLRRTHGPVGVENPVFSGWEMVDSNPDVFLICQKRVSRVCIRQHASAHENACIRRPTRDRLRRLGDAGVGTGRDAGVRAVCAVWWRIPAAVVGSRR
jgi:hypothetical protein